MGKFRNLTDKRFGQLVAMKPTEKRQGNSVVWECQCDCGRTVLVSAYCLTGGATKSCGCLAGGRLNLTGQRFGRLVALRATERRERSSVVWECRCDCGEVTFISAHHLTSRRNPSCGCQKQWSNRGGRPSLDLTGQKFGSLTALRPTEKRYAHSVVWECRCECGNTVLASSDRLKRFSAKICNCAKDYSRRGRPRKDISNQVFGMLTAVRPTVERRDGSVVWECQCHCGNTFFTPVNRLRQGEVKSCGCAKPVKSL